MERDSLRRFLFERLGVRGEWVRLDHTWRAALAHVEYPPVVRDTLGEAFAALGMLSVALKSRGSLTLQVSGAGLIPLLVVQSRGERALRGMARWQSDELLDAGGSLFGDDAQLALTLDPGTGRERYQGVVEIDSGHVAGALEHYFERSEQLATRLWLASDESAAVGLMLQAIPGEHAETQDWERLSLLAGTLTRQELLGWNVDTLLRRVFAEDDIRLFDSEPMRYQCDCSRERAVAILLGLGETEVEEILAEQGRVEMHCEFCRAGYLFDAVDVGAVFSRTPASSADSSTH
ncbi:MAG: Hsp33 family molecular chaperone HslO [Thiotrichales bacterium]